MLWDRSRGNQNGNFNLTIFSLQIHAQYEAACKQLESQQHQQLSEQLAEQLKQMAASSGEQQLELLKSLQDSITSQVSQVNFAESSEYE